MATRPNVLRRPLLTRLVLRLSSRDLRSRLPACKPVQCVAPWYAQSFPGFPTLYCAFLQLHICKPATPNSARFSLPGLRLVAMKELLPGASLFERTLGQEHSVRAHKSCPGPARDELPRPPRHTFRH